MNDMQEPIRKRRGESYFGLHFDFHAGEDCTEIGKALTREMLERMIERVKPDFVQCDCKGHPGIASYPTRIGTPAPGFSQDILRVWRDVTAARGVALYVHYSGVWDRAAIAQHRDWARVDALGVVDPDNTSVFGPYVDLLMIPQILEVAEGYGVDGVWVDGDCWATAVDYGEAVVHAFRSATGYEGEMPRTPGDDRFREFGDFCRSGFLTYLRHYVDALHHQAPSFQVASNWAFSSFIPERVSAEVDFLSGDFVLEDSLNSARMESRCVASHGKPWDLMGWGFASRWADPHPSTKSPVQMMQEAAVVISQGGAFQIYFQQSRDGSIREWQMEMAAPVSAFCRERQELCFHSETVPQVGLLLSGNSLYARSDRLFGPWGARIDPFKGTMRMLLDSQFSVDVLLEDGLEDRLSSYPVLVVPEWEALSDRALRAIEAYVTDGGAILAIGAECARQFQELLDVRLGESGAAQPFWLEHGGVLAGVNGGRVVVEPGKSAVNTGRAFHRDDFASPQEAVATISRVGKGRAVGIYADLGSGYLKGATPTLRRFVAGQLRNAFPAPIAELTGSSCVELSVRRKDGNLAIHLVNTSGPHGDPNVFVYDELLPISGLRLRLNLPYPPQRITWEPEGLELSHAWRDGLAELELPPLAIHAAIVAHGS